MHPGYWTLRLQRFRTMWLLIHPINKWSGFFITALWAHSLWWGGEKVPSWARARMDSRALDGRQVPFLNHPPKTQDHLGWWHSRDRGEWSLHCILKKLSKIQTGKNKTKQKNQSAVPHLPGGLEWEEISAQPWGQSVGPACRTQSHCHQEEQGSWEQPLDFSKEI